MNAAAQKALIKEFYTMLAMADIKETPGSLYTIRRPERGERVIRSHSSVDPATILALGGKLQALKLLRHCEMAKLVCHEDPEMFGVLAASFLRVVEEFPVLRGYYEQAKVGAAPHTWYRIRSHVS